MSDIAAQDAEWRALAEGPFAKPGGVPFAQQWEAWRRVFAGRPAHAPPPPAYVPTEATLRQAHVTTLSKAARVPDYASLWRWSATQRDAYWAHAIQDLQIPFHDKPRAIREGGAEDPRWLPGATMNISEACFLAPPERVAILFAREGEPEPRRITYGELAHLVARVSAGFQKLGLLPGDAVAIYMPMTVECVAAYLGIIRAGGVVVSIADSFAPAEVATRLRLGGAKAILTSAAFTRGGKTMDLYAKAREAQAPRAIVVGGAGQRGGDLGWDAFLGEATQARTHVAQPADTTNVLFSSGTTGDPKVIPWTHLTPIKAAADGRYHQDIHEDDVVAWPTSIGWMMGPWLIYATFLNQATMALFEGAPTSLEFLAFVQRARVSMLGLVPAIVRAWRASDAVGDRFAHVRVFSSTGEASNVEDYLWLMSTAGYRAPVVEYCGGTEIGGGHLTGTVVQPQSPAAFSTPALGLDFVILDHEGKRQVDENEMGEIWLVPPSIGLSQRLLNRDHHEEYYVGTPPDPKGELLRRHGDEVERLPGGYWRAHGRADDTMNLGGIKVSSLELERVMDRHPGVYQSAAVAFIPPEGGADQLIAFVVPRHDSTPARELQRELQDLLKRDLNPLYRIHAVVLLEALPRTASNKIMRRELRRRYKP